MLVRLRLIGSGDSADPYLVRLPHYELVEPNYAGGLAIVRVPDRILPPDFPSPGPGDVLNTPLGPVLRRLPRPALDRWLAWLDTRYAEHLGEYDPEPL